MNYYQIGQHAVIFWVDQKIVAFYQPLILFIDWAPGMFGVCGC